ncbi:MAG: hypothetical protein ACLQFR_20145 [Streptosporangiaceae bacterium]
MDEIRRHDPAGTDPQTPYGVFATPQHGVVVQWRAVKAHTTGQIIGPAVTTPVWVRASRYTSNGVTYYSAYTSSDGVHFTFVPGSTLALNLPGPLVAGITSDASNATNLAVSAFGNLA